jgi:hypothetical protein
MFNVIAQGEGAVFFLNGQGGLGKSFVYTMLLASVQRHKHVAIRVTSSTIAAFLLEGGRPSHLIFKIPITISKDNVLDTCAKRFC